MPDSVVSIMKKLFFLSAYSLYTLIVLAQGPTLLKGKIGSYPIIMELSSIDDTVANAKYFYESKRKDIELNGSITKDGVIDVVCYNNFEERFDDKSEKLQLKRTIDGYTGTWSTTKKALPVRLYFFSIDTVKNRFAGYANIQMLEKEDPLDYVRTAAFQFVKDSVSRMNGFDLDWYHEKHSGVELFRLRKPNMTEAIIKTNERLEEAQVEESNYCLSCTSPRTETEFDQSINHIFISAGVMSVNIFTSYDCGGAHPDFGSRSLNVDLTTGAALRLDDVLWFGGIKRLKEDSDEWFAYRDSVFAPKVVALLKQMYPEEMEVDTNEDGCDYNDPEVWNFPNWYFTDKGLYLGAIFSRVSRSCDEPEWPVIPYNIVKKYMRSSLKLRLPG
jgi:hypothetical protein